MIIIQQMDIENSVMLSVDNRVMRTHFLFCASIAFACFFRTLAIAISLAAHVLFFETRAVDSLLTCNRNSQQRKDEWIFCIYNLMRVKCNNETRSLVAIAG